MFTTEFITNGEIQTAYHDLGNGVPLVMVHGFTGSKLDFVSQAAWFVESNRVILYDQRGHGESSNQGPYTFTQMVTDLVGLLDALEVSTCHLLGHSLGGMVAVRAALAYPERFRSLILMDTAAGTFEVYPDKLREQLSRVVLADGCQVLLEGMQNQRPNAVVQRGIDFLGAPEHWRRVRVKLEQMDPQAFVDLSGAIGSEPPVLDQLDQITVPTTILVGQKDKPFIKPSKAMHKAIADSTLVKIPKAAHSPQYENADIWRNAVLEHLARSS